MTLPNDYVSIRVSTLRGDQKIDFNAYLRINDKMVLYLRRGDSFEGERLMRLKGKKLRKMFILNEEENKYRDYLQRNIELAYDKNSGQDLQQRSEIIQGQQQSNTEEVFENPGNIENYNTAKDAAGQYVQFLLSNSKALQAVMNISNDEFNIAHHGVTVATLAVSLAQKLNFNEPKKIQLMALGALLHDLGHFESGVALNRSLSEMTKEELVVYKGHPDLGQTKAQDKKHFDPLVLNIIAQHEECIDGSGFPKGLLENQMDPAVVIVSSANAMDRLLTFERLPRPAAVRTLMIDNVGRHPLVHIQHLSEIVRSLEEA